MGEMNQIQLPKMRKDVNPMWHLYSIQVESSKRKVVFEGLRKSGVGVQVNYIPAYWHPVFQSQDYPRGLCPVAENYYAGQISLPMHFGLTEEELNLICKTIKVLVE